MLYTAKGIASTIVTASLLLCLTKNFFLYYFGNSGILLFLPVLAICVLGPLHWSGYLVVLFLMDIVSSIANTSLGVVLLRCLPWDHMAPFYSQVLAIGGGVSTLSYAQMLLAERLGSWPKTVLIGHGSVFVLVLIFYL